MEDVAVNPRIRPKTFAKSTTVEVIKVNQHQILNEWRCNPLSLQNSPVQAFKTVFKRMEDTPGSFIPLGSDIINAMNKDENSVFIGVSFTAQYHPL